MIALTADPIDVADVLQSVQRAEAGAVVLFLGTTRQFTAGRETVELAYEAYRDMAEKELGRLAGEARQRWKLTACAVVHRVGVVPVGDPSVAVAVSSAHRDAAFEAGRWLIDTLKKTAPIWKQERWADGGAEWIHPEQTKAH